MRLKPENYFGTGPCFAPTEAELAAVLGCSTPRRCTIPPGALIKTNPGLFLQVREWASMHGAGGWHAYFNRKEEVSRACGN